MSNSEVDLMVSCPFNKLHRVYESRLQHHIIVCSRNYPQHFICSFNALHRFLEKEECMKHILNCPDATLRIPWKYSLETKKGDLKSGEFHMDNTESFHKESEDWEQEYEG